MAATPKMRLRGSPHRRPNPDGGGVGRRLRSGSAPLHRWRRLAVTQWSQMPPLRERFDAADELSLHLVIPPVNLCSRPLSCYFCRWSWIFDTTRAYQPYAILNSLFYTILNSYIDLNQQKSSCNFCDTTGWNGGIGANKAETNKSEPTSISKII